MNIGKKTGNADGWRLSPVYAASYDHLGYILWGVKTLERILKQETEWLEKYPGFRIGWDHEAFTYDYMTENTPELFEKYKQALQRFKGRLGVGSCTYGQPLSAFINDESNIRQLTIALNTTEKLLDYAQSVYIISEHAFHAQLPQLLVGCGFKGAILRTHFMMYGHNPEFDVPVGWWKAPDGSRIPTVPTYVGQTEPPLFRHKISGVTTTLDNRILTDSISEMCGLTLADFRRKFGKKIRPLVASRAEDPRAQESLIAYHDGDADYQWVILEDIFNMLPQPRTELDIQPNDIKPRMPWGYCGNWMWNRARDGEVRVLTAERLAAVSHALGKPSYEADLEIAWKNLLVAQHHDILICGLEDDFTLYSDKCLEKSDMVITSVMKDVASEIGSLNKKYIAFNPLAWERTETVSTPDGDCTVTVPALGYRSFNIDAGCGECTENPFVWQAEGVEDFALSHPEQLTEGTVVKRVMVKDKVQRLLTPFYEVFPGEKGGFRLIRSRKTGWDLLAPPKVSGTLAGVINGKDCESIGRFTYIEIMKDRAVLKEEGNIGGIPYVSKWTFYGHSPRIEWHGDMEFNNELVGRPKVSINRDDFDGVRDKIEPPETVTGYNDHEYKIRLRFYPYNTPFTTGIRDIPFGLAETGDSYIEGNYWTAISDNHVGIALFNKGLMGSVKEKDGALSSILAFSLPYVWHTRMLKGKYTYNLAILPFEGHWKNAGLHRQALEYNFPFIVAEGSGNKETGAGVWSPYKDTGDGKAVMSALYTKGGATYVRFYECEGSRSEVSLEWMGKPAKFTGCNLRDKELCNIGGEAVLGPWQIETLKINE